MDLTPSQREQPRGNIPGRLSERWAKGLIGLSVLTTLMAISGLFIYDGWHRVAFVLAFGAMSIGNFCYGFGSLAADEDRSRALRRASSFFGVIMLLALGATLAFQVSGT